MQNNARQTLPKSATSDPTIGIDEKVFVGPGGDDSWQTFTISNKKHSAGNVVIHFHGGGFINAVSVLSPRINAD